MKIYTKGGDKGQTSLLGGSRVPKYHARIESYGTVDELNSFLGLLRDQEINSDIKSFIIDIQNNLMIISGILAAESENFVHSLPKLEEESITMLEKQIDIINEKVPPLRSFILPGGHPIVSICHVSRSVCRRAERCLVKLSENSSVDEMLIKYINRLSDYLFVLSRELTLDLGVQETPWKP